MHFDVIFGSVNPQIVYVVDLSTLGYQLNMMYLIGLPESSHINLSGTWCVPCAHAVEVS